MERDFKLFLVDIVEAIDKIQKYVADFSEENFVNDELLQDAVIRRLTIIGEAVKNIPDSIKQEFPDVAWRKAAGMRDIVIHNYFGVDNSAAWDTVQKDLPLFSRQIEQVLKKYPVDRIQS
ncbi:MAG: protein of unknown function DUF86 [uncultured bacterium]|nr:MAG: protein of unknown function DUF86 [uncultured bacterium]